MKKTRKRYFTFIIAVSIFLTCITNTLATEISESNEPVQATAENADEIIMDYGYSENEVELMPADEKLSLAKAIVRNPEYVSVTSTVKAFDELSEIEFFVNLDTPQLLELGIPEDSIQECKNLIEELKQMSDEQLKENYQISDEKVKLCRMALEPDENYYLKDVETPVTTSGTISTSYMTFKLSKYSNSYNCNPAVSYRVFTYFEWLNEPFFQSKDEVGITWGGNLAQKNHRRVIHTATKPPDRARVVTTEGTANSTFDFPPFGFTCDGIDIAVNQGLKNWFYKEMYDGPNGYQARVKAGYTYVTIYQNKAQGYAADLAATYAHATYSLGWSGISFSKSGASVGFTPQSGFDYSSTLHENISY